MGSFSVVEEHSSYYHPPLSHSSFSSFVFYFTFVSLFLPLSVDRRRLFCKYIGWPLKYCLHSSPWGNQSTWNQSLPHWFETTKLYTNYFKVFIDSVNEIPICITYLTHSHIAQYLIILIFRSSFTFFSSFSFARSFRASFLRDFFCNFLQFFLKWMNGKKVPQASTWRFSLTLFPDFALSPLDFLTPSSLLLPFFCTKLFRS